MDWFPHYILDYDADTIHLTAFEDGCYSRLLRWYYLNERPLPDDDLALAVICRISIDEWQAISSRIKPFFVTRYKRVSDAPTPLPPIPVLFHKRCDAVLTSQNKKRKDGNKRQERLRHNNGLPSEENVSRVTDAFVTLPEERRVEEKKKDTEAKASDAEASQAPPPSSEAPPPPPALPAPPDFKRLLFNEGLDFLSHATGKHRDKFRPMVAKWCKLYGDQQTALALMRAQTTQAIEPLSYIETILKGGNHARNGSYDNRSAIHRAAENAFDIIAQREARMAGAAVIPIDAGTELPYENAS